MAAVSWSGLDGMQRNCERMASPENVMKAGRNIGNEVLSMYKASHRWRNRTHVLEGGAGVQVRGYFGVLMIDLYVTAFYGWFLEAGTRYIGLRYASIMPTLYTALPLAVQELATAIMGG